MHQSKPKQKANQGHGKQTKGTVRIIGGTMRGRKLHFSASEGLRPTLDRIRETVFNWLTGDVQGAKCLDLFAGSGALSFEAISRGADELVLVEKSSKVVKDLKRNCQTLNLNKVKVVNSDSANFLKNNTEKFDLVFLDPPFGKAMLEETLAQLPAHLSDQAIVYIEQEAKSSFEPPADRWEQIKFKKTSSFSYALYRLTSSEELRLNLA